MACPGSVTLEADIPDSSSAYAREGTAAHELAAMVLEDPSSHASDYVGKKIAFEDHGEDVLWLITKDMAEYVDDYVKFVRERAVGKILHVECKLSIGHITSEDGATGTSDVVIIDREQEAIEVIDLKYGMGVRVDAEHNEQMQFYALGALYEYELISDFSYVTMVIHQPRLNHVSEWNIPVDQLRRFGDEAREAADNVRWEEPTFNAGEKQCRFCKAKAVCPALRAEVTEIVGSAATLDDFTPQAVDSQTGDNYLPMAMSKVGMVEDWCKAVRAEVERRLLAGQTVDGYKLVEGRKGNRAWSDEGAVEQLFKSFRLRQEEMYDFKLISATKAEKLLKENPKRWAKAEQLITRSDGKPSVALAADKRSAMDVKPVLDDFQGLI
tara:strand:+ start:548 stop:1693 length:1146 start_codon:yes stop_codon:yes gene_type:complete